MYYLTWPNDFAGAIKLRILKWKVILGEPNRLSVITRVPIRERGRQESQSQRRRHDNRSRAERGREGWRERDLKMLHRWP